MTQSDRKLLFNAIDNDSELLVRDVLEKNHIDIVGCLIDFGYSPLEYALEIGSLNTARTLIDLKISLDSHVALHPLEIAISSNQDEMVKLLLMAGVDVNRDLGGGWSFLMRASICGNLEAAKLLVNAGATVNRMTPEGWTAHSIALREGFFALFRYLDSLVIDDSVTGQPFSGADTQKPSELF